MAKKPPPEFKGSRLRMAEHVESRPEGLVLAAEPWPSLDAFRSGTPLRWLCPLRGNNWVEMRDEMWAEAGLRWPSPKDAGWWPRNGPVWDGVALVPGTGGRQGVLLVEAKSHVDEVASSIDATPDSERRIKAALDETRKHLNGGSPKYWADGYYQYANRLAWLYYLRAKRGLDAWLLFVYFTGDYFESDPPQQRTFPGTAEEWKPPLANMKRKLGLSEPHALTPWLREAFLSAG